MRRQEVNMQFSRVNTQPWETEARGGGLRRGAGESHAGQEGQHAQQVG